MDFMAAINEEGATGLSPPLAVPVPPGYQHKPGHFESQILTGISQTVPAYMDSQNVPQPKISTPSTPLNLEGNKMKATHPNLFESLLTFRSRKHHTPKENFLTESFAYLLRIDECVCNRWLSFILGKNIEGATCKIATRQRERDSKGKQMIPDMLIYAQLSNGELLSLYFEHKWNWAQILSSPKI